MMSFSPEVIDDIKQAAGPQSQAKFTARLRKITPKPSPEMEKLFADIAPDIERNDWPAICRKVLWSENRNIFTTAVGFTKAAMTKAKEWVSPIVAHPAKLLAVGMTEDGQASAIFYTAQPNKKHGRTIVEMPRDAAAGLIPGKQYEICYRGAAFRKSVPIEEVSFREVDMDKTPGQEMAASDIAGIVNAQYTKSKFFGRWKRDMEFDETIKKMGYPSGLCGAYYDKESQKAFVVFEGTRSNSLLGATKDMVVNYAATNGVFLSHYKLAPDIVAAAASRYPSICIAGHSKGGGEAQYAAKKTGFPCVTFNSVGLPDIPSEHAPTATHFLVKHDPVSNIAGKDLEDGMSIRGLTKKSQRLLPGPRIFLDSEMPRELVGGLHKMETCRECLIEAKTMVKTPFATTDAYPSNSPLEGRLQGYKTKSGDSLRHSLKAGDLGDIGLV